MAARRTVAAEARRSGRGAAACARLLACASLLSVAADARAAREIVYVAIGGWTDLPGAARDGDPARVASRLEQAGRRVRVVDLTAAAATARTVRERQLAAATSLRPALVTLAVGPLDATAKTSLAAFSRDLQIVAELLRRTGAKVVVSNLASADALRAGATPAYRRRVDAFDWAIRRIARRNGLRLADVRAPGAARWDDAVARAAASALAPAAPPERGAERAPAAASSPAR